MSLCFFFKQKTAYEMRISDWSSDVCSSDLPAAVYEDQCSIKTEAAQVDLRIAGVALSCSRDAGIGAEKVAKECVEVGRPRALDFLARENRSEEHTSELQSLMRISYAVFCLKNKKKK